MPRNPARHHTIKRSENNKQLKYLVLLFYLTALSATAQSNMPIDWVKENNVSLKPSFGMSALMKNHDVQLIGFGEASHGQGSFFKHKINSFKWLAENAGYKIFALEAGFSEALMINQYVLYGEGSAKEGLKYLNYGVWQIEEFVDLIEWMREYNKEIPLVERVRFYGFDCQMSKGGVDYLKSAQGLIDYDFDHSELELLDDLLKLQSTRDERLAKSITSRLPAMVMKIEQKILESDKDDTFKKTSLTVLKNLQYFCDTESNNERNNDLNRSKYMAENIDNILEIEGREVKIALSAHNGHITTFYKQREIGYWLKQKYGSRYYALGYEFNQGKILGWDIMDGELVSRDLTIESSKNGTFGFLLSTSVGQDCFIDFTGKKVPEWFSQKQLCSDILGCYGQEGCTQRYTNVILSESYDGIIYIDETEAAKRM
ncbi:MAG: erythromycin esterase family protein [Saprospiraceae bacterium]|nr:erythromycin esterase family protein [Saprospiraceae bacterium]